MKHPSSPDMQRLLARYDIGSLRDFGIDSNSGPLGRQMNGVNVAAAPVGNFEPEKASGYFVGWTPPGSVSPDTPVASRSSGLHPFVGMAQAACRPHSLTPEEATSVHQAATASGYPMLCDEEELAVQQAVAEAVRDVLSGNRMMYVPPRILSDLMTEARDEAKSFHARCQKDGKKDLEGLRKSLKKLSSKFDNFLKTHKRCFADKAEDEAWAHRHGFACDHLRGYES